MKIEQNYGGGYVVFGRGHGKEGTLVQDDWSFPSLAEIFGWSLRRVQLRNGKVAHLSRVVASPMNCAHRSTDGTINCTECNVTAHDFIQCAAEFLDSKS
jgi:hypothetical protein